MAYARDRRVRSAAGVLPFLAILACADVHLFSPEFVAGAEPFEPPPFYVDLWRDVELCSGRRGDMRRVTWYRVPWAVSFEYKASEYNDFWWADHTVVLAGFRTDQADLVRHEMLHDLLGTGNHPSFYFEGRCGHLLDPEPIDVPLDSVIPVGQIRAHR